MVATEYVVGEERELAGGAKLRVREDGTFECAYCNEGRKNGDGFDAEQGVSLHWNRWCDQNPNHKVAQTNHINAERKKRNDAEGVAVRSSRGRRRLNLDRPPDPMDEVAPRPGGARGGPAAYFIRPDGATISEALIVSPNGAPMIHNGRDRGNSRYYQDRLKDRGYEYVGPSLTPQGVRKLADVIASNRQDLILYFEEEIEATEQTIREADKPEVRDQARTRRAQFMRQRDFYAKPLDVDRMLSELDDILKAQKLAALTPAQREAMQVLMDEAISGRVSALISRMEHSTASTEDGFTVEITAAADSEDF